jgi:SAM-dependent methyltransferase
MDTSTTPHAPVKLVDRWLKPAEIAPAPAWHQQLRTPHWTSFFDASVHRIFQAGGDIVDLGGGLRLDGARGDREDPRARALFSHYLRDPRVHLTITDYTDQYHPDRTEVVHNLSFTSGNLDGVFCLAVLEHVYDPKRAAEEIVRVLKPGGQALIYVPFLYRYHAVVTDDYYDYFRASKDGLAYLFRDASKVTLCPVRGLFETLLRFTPLHQLPGLPQLCRALDWGPTRMRDISTKQTSGYFIHLVR